MNNYWDAAGITTEDGGASIGFEPTHFTYPTPLKGNRSIDRPDNTFDTDVEKIIEELSNTIVKLKKRNHNIRNKVLEAENLTQLKMDMDRL